MTQLEALVGDIQHATYSMMPATLARAPQPQQTQPQKQGGYYTKVRYTPASSLFNCYRLKYFYGWRILGKVDKLIAVMGVHH